MLQHGRRFNLEITLLAVINTFVSSANNTSLEQVFIPRGKSLIYIMNNKSPKIDQCGTPHFKVHQLDKDFCCCF
jgi:hypothetical protein